MFYQTATDVRLRTPIVTPTDVFEGETMFNPKWGVLLVGLAVFAMAASYDADLGLAVGIVLVVLVSIALWIRVDETLTTTSATRPLHWRECQTA